MADDANKVAMATAALRERGLCGDVRDGHACVLPLDHDGAHGWDEVQESAALRAWERKVLIGRGSETSVIELPMEAYEVIGAALRRESALAARVAELERERDAAQADDRRAGDLLAAEHATSLRACVERDAALSDAQRLRKVLWSVEWCLPGFPACPHCKRTKAYGHASDCALAAALRGDGEK